MASLRKKQRNLVVSLLAACVVMVAAIAYIQSSDTPQTLTGLDKSAINRITITRSNGQSVLLELLNEQWQITEPTNQAANANRIEPLLTIAALEPSYSVAEVDRTAAGLEAPIASIMFNDKQFTIGELDVSGKRRYAESDGQVYFFPEWIAPLIEGGISALAAEPAN